MKSLYGQYIEEREGRKIFEVDHGFLTYFLSDTECYIADIFVVPERRKSGLAYKMCLEVARLAKEQDCLRIVGSIDPRALTATESMKALFAMGMELLEIRDNLIYLVKEL